MNASRKSASKDSTMSRRGFLVASAATAAAVLTPDIGVFAAGSDTIRVGVVGCGGRGTGAAVDCAKSAAGVKIVALGDLFQERLDKCLQNLVANDEIKACVDVSPDRCFTGFDAYREVMRSGVDLVILAAPPGFRPLHFQAAVKLGKHVFMEKPVCVDSTGARAVMEAGKLARQRRLGVVAGTQRRHQFPYIETIKRIHDGAVGEILSAECHWDQGGLWSVPRKAEWSDVEWQIRNWLYFTWLSGDHIVEQHVHNLDVINWAMNSHPVKAVGYGGRQVRTDPVYGHIFDHFVVQYEYPNGARLTSTCRQIDGCANNVSERVVGAKGVSNCAGWIQSGRREWKYNGQKCNQYVQEHRDLIESIRSGNPLNETQQVAESCLTAIMGRMSAYTGQAVTWEQAMASQENLFPENLSFGALPVPPVAMPGRTRLV